MYMMVVFRHSKQCSVLGFLLGNWFDNNLDNCTNYFRDMLHNPCQEIQKILRTRVYDSVLGGAAQKLWDWLQQSGK